MGFSVLSFAKELAEFVLGNQMMDVGNTKGKWRNVP